MAGVCTDATLRQAKDNENQCTQYLESQKLEGDPLQVL